MLLFLDTAGMEQTSIFLLDKKAIRAHSWPSKMSQQESLHSEIAKFLKKSKVDLKNLSAVGAVTGPGPFSRVRSGVVTANAFGYALQIPVVGIRKLGENLNFQSIMKMKGAKSISVYYDRKPNITKPKKK
jgi:tRNA threonylcarbamoyl adenosine modification protein YeaZ